MTLLDLENAVLEHFNYRTDDGNSIPRLRIRRYLNEWHRRILTASGLDRLRDATLSFTSVASTATVTLGMGVAKILRVFDTTNQITLSLESADWYRAMDANPTGTTGLPTHCILLGQVAIQTKPSTSAIYVVSDAAGDTTQKVTVDAINTSGNLVSAQVTLNGLTRVAVHSAVAYVDVTRFVVSAPTTGTISLYSAAAAGTLLGQIVPPQTFSRYFQLALWPTPASAVTYTLDYQRAVSDLALMNDEPWLPADFHYLLELGARVREYEKLDDSRQTKAEMHLAEGLRRLMAYVMNDRNRVYIPGEIEAGSSTSRLGAWYPRGT